ncbi:MAG: glycine zipper 2TM domain-containing protein [Holosporaceae bacterium]|jgi:outer membrane lipoprotein SlyB|nr:glycine zipper 2TM domain-containing protein [Holosporaceae bacterium]
MNKAVFHLVLCAGLLVVGCARDISSSSYNARTVGAASSTYPCTVVSQRKIMVEEGEYLEDNKTGGIMGAIAGGVLGNAMGGGRGRVVTTAAGALAGAAAGAYAEKKLKSQEGIEYIVKMESGDMKTIVQGTDVILVPGQAAYLVIDHRGRSRLIAR